MKISISLVAATGSFETDMNRASKTAQKRMREIEKTAKEVGKAIGAALVAGAGIAAAAIGAAIDRADELSKAAQKIGVTTEALSTLSYAADLADVSLEELQGGLARLTKFQAEAAQGAEKNVELFEALGIKFQNLDGTLRGTDEVFRDFARVFDSLPDGANKTALALEVFGRSGANLIPLLNEGADGIEKLEERARDLGLELDGSTGKAAEQFNDRLTEIKGAATGLATAVAVELLPDLNALVDQFAEGATQGDQFAGAAENIANGIRGVAFVADKAFQAIKGLTLGLVGMTAGVAEFLATYTLIGRLATTPEQRQALADIAAVTIGGSNDALSSLVGNEPAQSQADRVGKGRGIRGGGPMAGEADQARGTAEALGELYAARAKDTAATGAQTAAKEAAAEAARAERDAAKREAEAMEELAKRRAEQYDELHEIREREIEDQRRAKEAVDRVLESIRLDTELMGLNNLERSKRIALLDADVTATSAAGQEISAALDEWDRAAQIAEGMDVVRDGFQGLFSDLMSGAKSAKDAFKDFIDNVLDGISEIVARNLTENLLGSFGSTGGGSAGGGLMSFFASLFGGARAGGGDMIPGKAYLTGEQGPELVIPKAAGTVIPAGRTAAMLGGRGGDTIQILGSTSKRSLDRLAIERGRRQRRETARTS